MSDNFGTILGCVLYLLAATSIAISFGPQFKSIVSSRDTSGISLKIFLLHFLIGLSFFVSTMFFFTDTPTSHHASHYINCSIFTFINVFVIFTCGRIVWMKIQNCKEAKKLGITELEYCSKFVRTQKA